MRFYTIQDVTRFLINPLFPVFFIGLILLCRRQLTRKGLLLLLIYLYAVSIPCTSRLIMNRWWMADTVNRKGHYQVAVVPGGMVDYKWYVRHEAENGREISGFVSGYQQLGRSSGRILMGAAAIKSGLADTLLISDVMVRGVNETKILLDFLNRQGIPPEKIVVHGKPRHTLAEARSVRAYCEKNGIEKILLITSANHMRRAAALFRKQGLAPDLLSIPREHRPITWESFIPSGDGLEDTYLILYEMVGYLAYLARGEL